MLIKSSFVYRLNIMVYLADYISDYCLTMEGDSSYNCWRAYFELKELEVSSLTQYVLVYISFDSSGFFFLLFNFDFRIERSTKRRGGKSDTRIRRSKISNRIVTWNL